MSLAASLALVLGLCVGAASGQGCSQTCPPLNEDGVPVSSLCEGDTMSSYEAQKVHDICFPERMEPFSFESLVQGDYPPGSGMLPIIVVANQFVGCNAGRTESNAFSQVANQIHQIHPNVVFVASMKGGGSCQYWSVVL